MESHSISENLVPEKPKRIIDRAGHRNSEWIYFAEYKLWNTLVSRSYLIFLILLSLSLVLYITLNGLTQITPRINGFITSMAIFTSYTFVCKRITYKLIFRISWENFLHFHKTLGFFILIFGAVHGYRAGFKPSGSGMLVSVLMLNILSLSYFRRNHFNLFFVSHIILNFLIFCFSIKHGAFIVSLGFLIFLVDILFRYYFSIKNSLNKVPSTVEYFQEIDLLKLRFYSMYEFKSGRYALIRSNSLGFLHLHPFSVASDPKGTEITFYAKVRENWTKRMAELCTVKEDIQLFVDGSYGVSPISFFFYFKRIHIVVGGIGITPVISTLYEIANNKAMVINKKIEIHWFANSLKFVEFFQREIANLSFSLKDLSDSLSIKVYFKDIQLKEQSKDNPLFVYKHNKGLRGIFEDIKKNSSKEEELMIVSGPERMAIEAFDLRDLLNVKSLKMYISSFIM